MTESNGNPETNTAEQGNPEAQPENISTAQLADYSRKAAILVEATFFGDIPTADRWEITTRTIRSYRKQLKTGDPHLSAVFKEKEREFTSSWALDVAVTIKTGLLRLQALLRDGYSSEHELITAVSNSIKILGELSITNEALKED